MLRTQYKREMDQFGPRQEELEQLYTLIEGGTNMNRKKWIGRRAVLAIAACAALTLTAAAAAVPKVWDALREDLGAFAPYAQTIEGASCTDEGIEVQVLSAISDDLEARFYLAVRDVEEDRLSEFLTLTGRLTAGEEKETETKASAEVIAIAASPFTTGFTLVSYDPATKTALLTAKIGYYESARPTGAAQLELTGMSTRQGTMHGNVSCEAVTGSQLKSLPAGEDDTVVFRATGIFNGEYADAPLPSQKVVLAPGQNPMDIEGTEDMRISSMGFASDGCFHIRLEFAGGVKPATFEPVNIDSETGVNLTAGQIGSEFFCDFLVEGGDQKYHVIQERLVEGGMDILFPLLKVEDLKEIQSQEARVYGTYFRPGADIEGEWSTEFEMEYYPSTVLDWKGSVGGWKMQEVTLSPLSVTMLGHKGDSSGALANTPLYAVKKDGTEIAAEPGTGRYGNLGAAGGEGWEGYATWQFTEPLDLDEIVSLKIRDVVIPVK